MKDSHMHTLDYMRIMLMRAQDEVLTCDDADARYSDIDKFEYLIVEIDDIIPRW